SWWGWYQPYSLRTEKTIVPTAIVRMNTITHHLAALSLSIITRLSVAISLPSVAKSLSMAKLKVTLLRTIAILLLRALSTGISNCTVAMSFYRAAPTFVAISTSTVVVLHRDLAPGLMAR